MSLSKVSIELAEHIDAILHNVARHLTAENRSKVLGTELDALVSRGTGKTVAAIALYSDALRTTFGTAFIDQNIDDDEMEAILPLVLTVAEKFKAIGKKYECFTNEIDEDNVDQVVAFAVGFVSEYCTDEGSFGGSCEVTRRSGFRIVKNIERELGDSMPRELFQRAFYSAAEQIAILGGLTKKEQEYLSELKSILEIPEYEQDRSFDLLTGSKGDGLPTRHLDTQSAEKHVDEENFDLDLYTSIDEGAAKIMAGAETSTLELWSVSEISPSVAAELAKSQGELALGLTSISIEVAMALSRLRSGSLTLNSVREISPDVAAEFRNLAYHEDDEPIEPGNLYLPQLENLSSEAARALVGPAANDEEDILGCPSIYLDSQYQNSDKSYFHFCSSPISLTDEAIEALSTSDNALSLNRLVELSDAAAESLSRYSGRGLYLDGLTGLSDAAAESLSKIEDLSSLNGLTSLSDAAAESLSKSENLSSFDGLTSLSQASATSLSRAKRHLSLNGLKSMSDATAEILGSHEGGLSLNGLTSLSDAAAESLSKIEDLSSLNGLTSLSDAAAESLSKSEDLSSFDGLTSLSETSAASLSRAKRHLSLNGLKSLSDATAEIFGSHEGGLSLNGLTSLSDAAAASLSRTSGELSLKGLISLTDTAAESLRNHNGQMRFDGLSELSVMAAVHLAKSRDTTLGKEWPLEVTQAITWVREGKWINQDEKIDEVSDPSPTIAALIAANYRFLNLVGIQSLSDESAAALAKHQGSMSLSSLREISETGARVLAGHNGPLILNLDLLPDDIRPILAPTQTPDTEEPQKFPPFNSNISDDDDDDVDYDGEDSDDDGWDEESDDDDDDEDDESDDQLLTENIANQFLNDDDDSIDPSSFTAIEDAAAERLISYTGELFLYRLKSLSDAAAESLSRSNADLYLWGLASLSDTAAESLGRHSGELGLGGLTSLSDAAAKSLSSHNGILTLGGLKGLSDAAAESLSKINGGLYLNGLLSLSDDAAKSLSRHQGELDLSGLKSLSDAAARSLATHVAPVSLTLSNFPANIQGILKSDDEESDSEIPTAAVERQVINDPAGTIINSIGMKLVPIPAGEFMMGDDDDEVSELHKVILTRPYYLGVYEVTQEEYQRVMGTNPSHFKGSKKPVENVSWNDAVEFCKKLSEFPEEKFAGRVYRLPTEAEWEYACRAGTTTTYSFGEAESDLGDYAWSCENSRDRTHPVGSRKANPWGLYDMHGNVDEWCQDWYAPYPSGIATDPQGPSEGSTGMSRGGSWGDSSCWSAYRNYHPRDEPSEFCGFRVAVGQ